MESVLRRINGVAAIATRLCCAGLVAGIFLVAFAQVVFRYGLNSSLFWAEEAVIYAMVWLAFLGSSLLLEDWGHIGINALLRAVSPRARGVLVLVVHAAMLVFLAFLVYYGTTTALFGFSRRSVTMDIPTWWIKLAIPVSAGLMGLHLIERLLADLGHFRRGELGHFGRYAA
ncbi:MAG TPA: TRAP transporter small permease [Solirubrobacterales bacterium]|nr:TRAP transporter small permease [Solirubrobacterales bacterium]